MKDIKLICEGCGAHHDLKKTSEIPDDINLLYSNWCIKCEDNALEPYEEWYAESRLEEPKIIDPNQLDLFA